MTLSEQRILTTHGGSLPRSKAVTDGVFARELHQPYNEGELRQTIAEAVDVVVKRQVEAGVDLVSDGEMSKISYATYIKDRITGFEGDSPRNAPSRPLPASVRWTRTLCMPSWELWLRARP